MISNFKFQISNYRKGFTIIEIMIAICVLSFGIILIYDAFFAVVSFTYTASARAAGSYLTQEGLEIIQNIRDTNSQKGALWSDGLLGAPCDFGCQADYKTGSAGQLAKYSNAFLAIDQDGFYGYEFGARPTIFKRKITVTPVPGTTDALHVDVQVIWNYNNQPFSVGADEYLYDWK